MPPYVNNYASTPILYNLGFTFETFLSMDSDFCFYLLTLLCKHSIC